MMSDFLNKYIDDKDIDKYKTDKYNKYSSVKFSWASFIFTLPYLMSFGLWESSLLYFILFWVCDILFFTFYNFLPLLFILIIKIIYGFCFRYFYIISMKKRINKIGNSDLENDKKTEKIDFLCSFKLLLFIIFLLVNYFLFVYLNNTFNLSWLEKYLKEKTVDKNSIINIIENEGTIVKNNSYFVDLNYNINYNMSKSGKIIWSSSDPLVVDVSECKQRRECSVKSLKPGSATVSVRLEDKRKNVLNTDEIIINVLDSDTIHFYNKDLYYYSDKDTDLEYKDDESYTKLFDYSCKNLDCDVVSGKYVSIIKDGDIYYEVDPTDESLNMDMPTRRIGCNGNFHCNEKFGEKFKFSDLVEIVDNKSYKKSVVNTYIFGKKDDKSPSYTGFYDKNYDALYEGVFYKYYVFNNFTYLLSDLSGSHIYDAKDNKTFDYNFVAYYLGVTYDKDVKYYYLSNNRYNYNRDCVILDNNYNTIFNSKRFEYANIYNGKLYSYETINNKKEFVLYDLTGSRIESNLPNNFEFIDYTKIPMLAFGIINDKINILYLDSNSIIDDSVTVSRGYSEVRVFEEQSFDIIEGISVSRDDYLDSDEYVISIKYDDRVDYYYYKIIITGTGYGVTSKKLN